jgi:hypothetical protein
VAGTTDTRALSYDLILRDPSGTRSFTRQVISNRTRVSLID